MFPLELPNIDAALNGGVRRGWLALLAGASASGKTLLLYQLALDQAQAGRNVLILPTGGAAALRQRLLEQNLSQPLPSTLRWPQPNQQLRDVDELEKALNSPTHSFLRPSHLLIDDLDSLAVGASAPEAIKQDRRQQPGYLMARLSHLAKDYDLFVAVSQRAPAPPGLSFPYLTGRGGALVTDVADLVLHVHLPEHEPGLDDYERNYRRGQMKLELVKNRYGPQTHEDLYLDPDSSRIILASKHEGALAIAVASRPINWAQPRGRPSSLAERAAAIVVAAIIPQTARALEG